MAGIGERPTGWIHRLQPYFDGLSSGDRAARSADQNVEMQGRIGARLQIRIDTQRGLGLKTRRGQPVTVRNKSGKQGIQGRIAHIVQRRGIHQAQIVREADKFHPRRSLDHDSPSTRRDGINAVGAHADAARAGAGAGDDLNDRGMDLASGHIGYSQIGRVEQHDVLISGQLQQAILAKDQGLHVAAQQQSVHGDLIKELRLLWQRNVNNRQFLQAVGLRGQGNQSERKTNQSAVDLYRHGVEDRNPPRIRRSAKEKAGISRVGNIQRHATGNQGAVHRRQRRAFRLSVLVERDTRRESYAYGAIVSGDGKI